LVLAASGEEGRGSVVVVAEAEAEDLLDFLRKGMVVFGGGKVMRDIVGNCWLF
jgi:hypothetical protein